MHAESVAHLPRPPHSEEAEQALLGALLIDGTAWARVAGVVRPRDIFRPDHREIFAAIDTLARKGEAHDVLTVSAHLENAGRLDAAGGRAYLISIARDTPTAANARHYAQIVRDRGAARALATFAADTERSLAEGRGRSAEDLIVEAAERLLQLQASARTGKGLVDVETLVRELVDDLDRRQEKPVGLSVGLSDFDEMTSGLEPGDLVVIAARPSMGKTALMVTMADHVSAAGSPTAVFSAEMPAPQLMRRHVARNSGVSQSLLRRAEKLTDVDWASITPALGEIAKRTLWIDDTAAPSLSHIQSECYALKMGHGLALAMVDYVQLVQGAGANRYEQLRDVAYGLKALAKDLAIPIILLAQLNRGVESREQKRPHVSDLRDSGAIEEAADIVGLLYSEGNYDPTFGMPYVLECRIEKHRNGARGECLWHFAGACSRVTVLDPGARAQYRPLLAQRRHEGSDL